MLYNWSKFTWAAVQVVLLDVLVVDGLVEGDEASGEVADEEDNDDSAEHQRLAVLIGGVLGVGSCSHRACKVKKSPLDLDQL